LEHSVITPKSLSISVNYQHTHLGNAFESERKIDDPLDRKANVQIFGFEAEYGLTTNVTLLLNLNYVIRNRELTARNTLGNVTQRLKVEGDGFGDPALMIKYLAIAPSLTRPFELALGGGAKLPIGDYRQERNGARLPIDLQPSTGAIDLLSWLYASYNLPRHHLRFNIHGLYRYAGVNFDGYKFGDELIVSTRTEYSPRDYLTVALSARGRFAKQDYSNRRVLQATGSSAWYIEPAVSYFEKNSTFRIFGQIPVYQNVRSIQLTPQLGGWSGAWIHF
ncbi:MAG: transporter, partial [bacterium]